MSSPKFVGILLEQNNSLKKVRLDFLFAEGTSFDWVICLTLFPFIPIQMSNLQIKEEKVKPDTNGESLVTTLDTSCTRALPFCSSSCGVKRHFHLA